MSKPFRLVDSDNKPVDMEYDSQSDAEYMAMIIGYNFGKLLKVEPVPQVSEPKPVEACG
jgi:hypothetical protein